VSAALHLLEPLAALARRAGEAIMDVYASDFAVHAKDDDSPVTAADLAAQRVIVEGLAGFEEILPVISEEATAAPWHERRQWQRYWLVDPLDGTREFIKRNGEFTVNIALVDGHDTVASVVLAPASGDGYLAVRGAGAFRQQAAGGQLTPIRARSKAEPPLLAGSRSHGLGRLAGMLEPLGAYDTFALGSSLKFCVIARGDADAYLRLGPTCEWDTAAGQCVLEEAGGKVVDLAGQRLRYNTRDTLVNPEFLAAGDTRFDWLGHLAIP
jgi:3'(2'), 5'-bisphosphate nucleotidase